MLDAIHVIGAYVFALYLVVHVYMATLGRTAFSHIKAMIVGYEEEPDEPGMIADSEEQLDEPDVDLPSYLDHGYGFCEEPWPSKSVSTE